MPVQTPAATQPPPDLPSMPGVSAPLTAYLRNFSLWARNAVSDKIASNTAAPGILLQANDAPAGTIPAVFMLQVTTAGAVVVTPVPLGGPNPG